MMVSQTYRNNLSIIKFIATLVKKPALLKAILKVLGSDFYEAITELVYNCVYGDVEFTEEQKLKLLPYKRLLIILATKDQSESNKLKAIFKIRKVLNILIDAVSKNW
jgi:hypothetical protein